MRLHQTPPLVKNSTSSSRCNREKPLINPWMLLGCPGQTPNSVEIHRLPISMCHTPGPLISCPSPPPPKNSTPSSHLDKRTDYATQPDEQHYCYKSEKHPQKKLNHFEWYQLLHWINV